MRNKLNRALCLTVLLVLLLTLLPGRSASAADVAWQDGLICVSGQQYSFPPDRRLRLLQNEPLLK